jgi:hypothetical protein
MLTILTKYALKNAKLAVLLRPVDVSANRVISAHYDALALVDDSNCVEHGATLYLRYLIKSQYAFKHLDKIIHFKGEDYKQVINCKLCNSTKYVSHTSTYPRCIIHCSIKCDCGYNNKLICYSIFKYGLCYKLNCAGCESRISRNYCRICKQMHANDDDLCNICYKKIAIRLLAHYNEFKYVSEMINYTYKHELKIVVYKTRESWDVDFTITYDKFNDLIRYERDETFLRELLWHTNPSWVDEIWIKTKYYQDEIRALFAKTQHIRAICAQYIVADIEYEIIAYSVLLLA